jgi:putative tryptophan/tyrosine transport system substrate-binding protein
MGHAQQPERLRRVSVLMPWPESDPQTRASVTAFAQALGRFGWVEGKNIRIDYRFAAGDPTLFKAYAAELVGLMPDAILAGATPAVAPLRQQTRTIPIVFVHVVDPVGLGFVQSLARPGGNITGFSSYDAELAGKWLQLAQGDRAGRHPGRGYLQPGHRTFRAIVQPLDRGRRAVLRSDSDACSGA